MTKANKSTFKYMALFMLSIIALPFLLTLAWFTSSDSASGNLEFGQAIKVTVSEKDNNEDYEIISSSGEFLLPGSKVTVNPITLNVESSNTPLVLRAKINVTSSGETDVTALKSEIYNTLNISTTNWFLHDGWYYYIGTSANAKVMTTVADSNGTASSGQVKFGGAVYNNTRPSNPPQAQNRVLSSVWNESADTTINFSNIQSENNSFRISQEYGDELAGQSLSVRFVVQAVQDYVVLNNNNVLPTIANVQTLFPEEPLGPMNQVYDITMNGSILPAFIDETTKKAVPINVDSYELPSTYSLKTTTQEEKDDAINVTAHMVQFMYDNDITDPMSSQEELMNEMMSYLSTLYAEYYYNPIVVPQLLNIYLMANSDPEAAFAMLLMGDEDYFIKLNEIMFGEIGEKVLARLIISSFYGEETQGFGVSKAFQLSFAMEFFKYHFNEFEELQSTGALETYLFKFITQTEKTKFINLINNISSFPEPYSQEEFELAESISELLVNEKIHSPLLLAFELLQQNQEDQNEEDQNQEDQNQEALQGIMQFNLRNYYFAEGNDFDLILGVTEESGKGNFTIGSIINPMIGENMINITADEVVIGTKLTQNYGNTNLSNVKTSKFIVSPQDSLLSVSDGVLYSKDNTILIAYPSNKSQTSFSIPSTVNKVAENAFKNVVSLNEINVVAGQLNVTNIVQIGKSNSLVDIVITANSAMLPKEQSIYSILSEEYNNIRLITFDQSTGLEYSLESGNYNYKVSGYTGSDEIVKVPATHEGKAVNGIKANAFYGSSSVQSIVLPDSIAIVENNAFAGMTNLKEVYFNNEQLTSLGTTIFGTNNNVVVFTTQNNVNRFKAQYTNATSVDFGFEIDLELSGPGSEDGVDYAGDFDIDFAIGNQHYKFNSIFYTSIVDDFDAHIIAFQTGSFGAQLDYELNAPVIDASQGVNVKINEQIALQKDVSGTKETLFATPGGVEDYNDTDHTSGQYITENGAIVSGNSLSLIIKFTLMLEVQCFTRGTLVTLADGSTKTIENVTYDDLLLVWDFDRGEFSYSYPVWISQSGVYGTYYLMEFDDGSEVEIVISHRLFSPEENEFIRSIDAIYSSIGKKFVRQIMDEHGNPKLVEVTCTNITKVKENIEYYNMVTSQSLNFFANGFLGSTGISNLYQFEKVEEGIWVHNQEQLEKTKTNNDVFPYEMFDPNVVPYYIYVAYRLGETKNMADILAKLPPYNQYPIEAVYGQAIKAASDYFLNGYLEDMVAHFDTFKITSSEGENVRIDSGGKYTLKAPTNTTNFKGWYNTFDGKLYQAGEMIDIYMNTHFIARYN